MTNPFVCREIDRLEQQEKTLNTSLHVLEDDEAPTATTIDQRTAELGRTVASIESSNISHGEGLG